MTSTGDLIKTARESQKITQRDLAKRIGMHFVYLNRIESGKSGLPTKYVNNICRVLSITKLALARAILEDKEIALEKKIRE